MKFKVIGKGFIFPKHKEAIESIKGEIVEENEDCVVILTPNYLHYEMIMDAVKRGKIVLCEKPLVLNSKQARELTKYPNIFTVFQWRYLPIKFKLAKFYDIRLNLALHRDRAYFQSWKGDKEKSGGILFILGIHCFDLIRYLFGKPTKVALNYCDEKSAFGYLRGKNYICNWRITLIARKENQQRSLWINSEHYNLSSKENLHKFVYQDLIKSKGITPKETLPIIQLIEKMYENFNHR